MVFSEGAPKIEQPRKTIEERLAERLKAMEKSEEVEVVAKPTESRLVDDAEMKEVQSAVDQLVEYGDDLRLAMRGGGEVANKDLDAAIREVEKEHSLESYAMAANWLAAEYFDFARSNVEKRLNDPSLGVGDKEVLWSMHENIMQNQPGKAKKAA